MTECVNRLITKPPQNGRDARIVFSYFSSRLGEIGQNSVAKIADAPIVPVSKERPLSIDEKVAKAVDRKQITPRQCYLGSSSTYGEIFDFVDFGNEANALLLKCGSKNEPTTIELATLACQEPARLLGIMQSPEKYLSLLRTLANELPQLKRDKTLFKQMKSAKFLLGSIEIPGNKTSQNLEKSTLDAEHDSGLEDMEDAPIKQYQLTHPSHIVVVSQACASCTSS